MIQKLRGSNEKGFTLIELMIVIAIIGILAAIAIPNFVTYRQRGYDAAANADVKNAFTAAQAYFTDYETGDVDEDKIAAYGYTASTGVTVTVNDGESADLELESAHENGAKIYTIDSAGAITKADQ